MCTSEGKTLTHNLCHKNYGSNNNSIILGRKGYGWGEYPHYYLNYDIGKYGFPEGTDGRIATQVNMILKISHVGTILKDPTFVNLQ